MVEVMVMALDSASRAVDAPASWVAAPAEESAARDSSSTREDMARVVTAAGDTAEEDMAGATADMEVTRTEALTTPAAMRRFLNARLWRVPPARLLEQPAT
jgi:hypothetical protein